MSHSVAIGIVGDFEPTSETHHVTNEALRHAAEHLSVDLEYRWVGTTQLAQRGPTLLESVAGIWAAPGSPESMAGVLEHPLCARATLALFRNLKWLPRCSGGVCEEPIGDRGCGSCGKR